MARDIQIIKRCILILGKPWRLLVRSTANGKSELGSLPESRGVESACEYIEGVGE